MIEEILPAEVVAVEALADPPGVTLFPEEEAVIAKAVDKRRREFSTVRRCARLALATLGLPRSLLLPGEARSTAVAGGRGGQHDALRGVPCRRGGPRQ